MSTRPHHVPSRVLALVVAPRFSGAAVVDGFGLADFASWNHNAHLTLDEKARALAERAARLARLHRPGRIVLGIPLREDYRGRLMRAEVRRSLGRFGVAFSERPVAEARRLVLGRTRGRGANALHAVVVRGFFPELADRVRRTREAGAYWRHAFDATAVAVEELVEIAPRAAAALAQPEAFASDAFAHAIAASDARKYPALFEPAPERAKTTVPARAPEGRSAAPMPAADHAAWSSRRLRRTTAGPPDPGRPWEGAPSSTNAPSAAAVGV
jgi:hypothetical protein